MQDSGVRAGQGCESEEGGGELVVVVGPPVAPAVIALAATGPVPHTRRSSDHRRQRCGGRLLRPGDSIVHGGEQAFPGPPGPIRRRQRRAVVVLARRRVASRAGPGQIRYRSAHRGGRGGRGRRRGAQGQRTRSRAAQRRCRHEKPRSKAPRVGTGPQGQRDVVPGETKRVEPTGGVMQPAQQPGDGRQRGIGLTRSGGPRRR